MSLKQIKSLVTGTAGLDTVSNHDFKTPEELHTYLKGLEDRVDTLNKTVVRYEKLFTSGKVVAAPLNLIEVNRKGRFSDTKPAEPISDEVHIIKIPNLKTLQKNFDIVDELHEKLDILDSISNQVQYSMHNVANKGGVLRSVKSLYTSIRKKVEAALKFLAKVAKGKEPEAFRDIVVDVKDRLLKDFAKKFTKFEQNLYVHTTEDDEDRTIFWFTHYLSFSNLVYNGEDVYPNYYVVFTGKIDPIGQLTVYVNTLLHFKTPGKFNPGHPVKDISSAERLVGTLLSSDEFTSNLHGLAVPVSDKELNPKNMKNKDVIKSIKVGESTIAITLNSKVKRANLQTVIGKLIMELNGILAPFTKGKLKYKVETTGSLFTITFSIVPKDPESIEKNQAEVNKIKLLQTRLGFSDAQIKNVIRALHK